MSKDYSNYINDKLLNLSDDFINKFKYDFLNNRREKLDKIYSGLLTKMEIRALVQKLGLQKINSAWYTNGREDIKVSDGGIIPEGYYSGRTNGCEINTSGYKWYNDGVKNYLVEPTKADKSLSLGYIGKTTSGYKFYNNGEINICLSPEEEIPEGFTLGEVKSTARKIAGINRRKTKYNNGHEEISILINDLPPEGFNPGRLTGKIRKKSRDLEFLNRGYVPLKDLVNKYNTVSWFKHLTDLDYIKFDEPYIYINIKEIPRIEDYINSCSSYGESEILNFLKSIYSGEIITHSRSIIEGKELDFYIPEKSLAIEFNGIWYHSSLYKDKKYHLNKTELCNDKGIRLIHIFEDLWVKSPEIYKSIISSALGIYDKRIYARKCKIVNISRDDEKKFLSENHLQGYAPSTKCLGLIYEGEIVQLISFRKSRFTSGEIELLRMCTKINTQVIGGFSKLVKNSGESNFISYVDRSLYDGHGYHNIGFKTIKKTPPSYFYFKKDNLMLRLNRIQFQKHKLSNKLKNYDPNLTEIQNMENNDYILVYDCGTYKLKYTK